MTPTQLDKLAASNIRTFEIVKLHRRITASLCQEWYDEFDLLTTASHLVNNDEADLDGEIIVFLPQELGALAAGLVKSLGSRSKVSATHRNDWRSQRRQRRTTNLRSARS